MRPIPAKLREKLSSLPRMKMCVAQAFGGCDRKIDWDHVWVYAGQQINEEWAIVGLCRKHHMAKEGNTAVRHCAQKASLKLATKSDLARYPRKDWEQIRRGLGGVDNFISW